MIQQLDLLITGFLLQVVEPCQQFELRIGKRDVQTASAAVLEVKLQFILQHIQDPVIGFGVLQLFHSGFHIGITAIQLRDHAALPPGGTGTDIAFLA